MSHVRVMVVLLFFGLSLTGCKGTTRPEPKRYPVSGTVTIDGKPLPSGKVHFKTVAAGSIDTVEVKDGAFSGQAEAGDRRVEVSSTQEVKNPNATPGMGDTMVEETVAPEFNTKSELTAKVTESGPNEFKFEVKSKAK